MTIKYTKKDGGFLYRKELPVVVSQYDKSFWYFAAAGLFSYDNMKYKFATAEDATRVVEDMIMTESSGSVAIYDLDAAIKQLNITLVE